MISKDIILQAKKRDREAFEKIYIEFKDFVWNVTLKTTQDQTMAEDAAAEVFIKVFQKIKKFNFRSSFRTWLYRVAVNTALNYLDKENRRRAKQLNADYRELHDKSSESYNGMVARDTATRLLSGLNDDERMLIVLREIQGLTYREIENAMDMNIGTVKTKIYRARNKLRKIYSNMEIINDL